MPEPRTGIAIQILGLLAEQNFPGLTRGEIRNQLNLPADVEITMRIRELRKAMYGAFIIRVERISKTEHRYYLLDDERRRAKEYLDQWRAA